MSLSRLWNTWVIEALKDDIEGIVTYQAVLPYNDSEHERSHAENIISLEPVDVGGEESCL